MPTIGDGKGFDFARCLYAWMNGLYFESVKSGIDTEEPLVISIIQRQVTLYRGHSGYQTDENCSVLWKASHRPSSVNWPSGRFRGTAAAGRLTPHDAFAKCNGTAKTRKEN
jgi:hypothetical protein